MLSWAISFLGLPLGFMLLYFMLPPTFPIFLLLLYLYLYLLAVYKCHTPFLERQPGQIMEPP